MDDLDVAAKVVRDNALLDRCQVFFSPVFGQIEPAQIVDYLSDSGLRDTRVQLQLHKLIWPNVERGV